MFGKSGKLPSGSVSQHNFAQVPGATIPRSAFDRSHSYRTTFNASYLVPIFWDDVLPGDTCALTMTSFCRLTTPIKPIMDNMYMDVFFFYVPLRILWVHWENMHGAQANPGDSISYLTPQITSPVAGWAVNSLQDYFALPTVGQVSSGFVVTHDNFLCRAYNQIFNDWFRDENLQNSVVVDTGDGPDTPSNYTLLKRGKRFDYFTGCLPWTQKGTAVSIPLTGNAIIKSNDVADAYGRTKVWNGIYGHLTPQVSPTATSTTSPYEVGLSASPVSVPNQLTWPVVSDVSYNYADLSTATTTTINALRQSFQIQKLLERDARGGTRFTEILRSHFGVTSPDSRLQRAEFLGSASTPINVYPVGQTQATGATGTTTPQGNLTGFGVASHKGVGFTKSFVEHGVVIGLASVRADLSYQQGLDRHRSKMTRYDYYYPALAHIGEQAVLTQEIFCDGSGPSGADGTTFGYQERYAEYRYKPSRITGLFRSTSANAVDFWHLSEKFATAPTLSSTFVQDNLVGVLPRAVAVTSEPQFYFDAYFNYKCARPLPTYGVPGFIDRF